MTIALIAISGATGAGAQTPVRVAIFSSGDRRLAMVKVETAATPANREHGLMFRKHLDEDAGMLFVFAAPQKLYFWMKNTEIPLDMIFADQNGKVVGIVRNAQPYSEQPVGPGKAAQYVLEVNGGFCQRHGVDKGDFLRFIGSLPVPKL
ncbi:MAG: DUF192 domain-containing protein [Candidatus Binataceae bacterium]|nr:DUF192 domain-containing protein [Candidatus Binataceae bacterium]